MSIDSARKFLLNITNNYQLATRFNEAVSMEQLVELLAESGYEFNDHELDEAYNNLLTKIQFEEDANAVKMSRQWYDMLILALNEQK